MTTETANLPLTAEQIATAIEDMAVNPKGGKMAAIAYKKSANLIRRHLVSGSASPTTAQDDKLSMERDLSNSLMGVLKAIHDAPTMAAGYEILADWAGQFWLDEPVALQSQPAPQDDAPINGGRQTALEVVNALEVTERAKAIAWAFRTYGIVGDHGSPDEVWDGIGRAAQNGYLAAARAVPVAAPAGWQPIETAPKDGTPVLVWDEDAAWLVAWTRGFDNIRKEHWEAFVCDGYRKHFGAVAWMPLPPAPGAVTAQQPQPDALSGVLAEVAAERRRQIEVEGWTPEHDDDHVHGQMARAAGAYAQHAAAPDHVRSTRKVWPAIGYDWPWDREWWKPKDRKRDLIRAAALIVAEVERIDRAALRTARQSASTEGERS